MNSLYFDDSPEPDDWFYKLNKRLEEIYDRDGISYIKFDFDSSNDFYTALESMRKIYDECKIYATSREGRYEVVIENTDDGANEEVTDSE